MTDISNAAHSLRLVHSEVKLNISLLHFKSLTLTNQKSSELWGPPCKRCCSQKDNTNPSVFYLHLVHSKFYTLYFDLVFRCVKPAPPAVSGMLVVFGLSVHIKMHQSVQPVIHRSENRGQIEKGWWGGEGQKNDVHSGQFNLKPK